MLLDPESLDLAQEIESLLAAVPAEWEGQVKPELMQSVLEIATRPCPNVNAAGEELRELRRSLAGRRGRARASGSGAAGDAPVRALGGPADRPPPPLSRDRRGAQYIARREF